MSQKISIGMVSLGCDKNRVDAELMLGVLRDKGYSLVNDENKADVIIVNTCGFIDAAKEESIDSILELSKNKEHGNCKVLIASGCLAERYSSDLLKEIPELDAVVGVGNYLEIDNVIKSVLGGSKGVASTNNVNYDVDFYRERVLTTPEYTAYIKIAEGCNNDCSYCIIPKLRGIYRSRSMENIIKEAEHLSINGTKEIILVAQDTSKYGIDIYGRNMLHTLVNKISKLEGIEWIRLLYCYPEDINEELILEISQNDKVCKYLDIPIQHVNDDILRRMRRISSKKSIEELIAKLRNDIPDIIIRTSLIVGFPGETDEQFQELYDFLKEYKLDRVGVFTYSREEDTDAALYDEQVEESVKKSRQRKLLALQRTISSNSNKQKIGRVYKVLIDGYGNSGRVVGRTYGDAPEIDGVVYIKGENTNYTTGDFMDARIVDAYDYDLLAEVINKPDK